MIVNKSKTKEMVVGDKEVDTKIVMEKVRTFQYLEIKIDGKMDPRD